MTDELKLDLKSMSITEEKKSQLKQLFPEVFAENKVDFERLKQVLGENIEVGKERYGMTWAGKSNCFKIIQEPSVGTLKPCEEESVNFDKTDNIFIEGDNLEVLKLLQKSYYGKIKMVYIDPPYNTGNEFIYPDNFSETLDTYLKYTQQKDSEGKKFSTNVETDGRFHSKWMNMIYTRLYLARNLMRDDGIIFVSIDDNEINALRLIMDEIFGVDNFQSVIVVQSNKRGQTYKDIAKTHEYILVYSKSLDAEIFELEKTGDSLPYTDSVGAFDLWELRNRNPKFGKFNRPNLFYPIYVSPKMTDESGYSKISLTKTKDFSVEVFPLNSEGEESCWRWGKEKILKTDLVSPTPILVGKQKRDGNWNVYEKSRKSSTKAKSLWNETEVISEQGTIELGKLDLADLFDHPKPLALVKKCIKIGMAQEGIALDFFAGSGTLGDAIYQCNKEDGGNRKFICVQLPEEINKGKYKTISDVCKERIRRAGKAIKTDKNGSFQEDLGFKVYKLDKSNFKIWETGHDQNVAGNLKLYADHIDHDATPEEILYEILIKSGFELTTKVEKIKVERKDVFAIEDGAMFVYLGNEITKELTYAIAEKNPSRFVCLDQSFQHNDQLKTNTVQLMKSRSIEFRTV